MTALISLFAIQGVTLHGYITLVRRRDRGTAQRALTSSPVFTPQSRARKFAPERSFPISSSSDFRIASTRGTTAAFVRKRFVFLVYFISNNFRRTRLKLAEKKQYVQKTENNKNTHIDLEKKTLFLFYLFMKTFY